MTEPTILCPKCHEIIKLTDAMAAPLVESARRDFEKKLQVVNAETAQKEKVLAEREQKLAASAAALDQQVSEKLQAERGKIAAEELRKAKLALAGDFEQKSRENQELAALLKSNNEKLAAAQQAQAEVLRKQRELDDARREMDLTIEKRINESLGTAREQARKDIAGEFSLKAMENEKIISDMKKQIEELKRKSEQGSQQLQGEVLELQLEQLLAAKFPHDSIEPVPKGEHGGDILHRVNLPTGTRVGTILWESKRTKNWSDGWLTKLREDQRAATADVAIIVSTVLPKEIETFDCVDGVWITHPRALLPVALALRQSLLELHAVRQSAVGQDSKMKFLYDYLTGPKFRLRFGAIVEAFGTMHEDLLKEKKAIMKQWAKREEQITRVVEASVTMYGELQGITGKSLAEIEGLDLKQLGSADADE